MRKTARQVAEGRKRKTVVDTKKLEELLGAPRFEYGELEPEDQTGAATGLVVTEVGGDVVSVEVTRMPGKEDFILTGQLGEVMRESARAGLSWIRAHADELGIEREAFEKSTLHIHVPAGGIPKDGPSAGITMALAMVSAYTGIPVRKDVAMTGEITLRGRVLPDRWPQEQDPGCAPRRCEDRDPAHEEPEGPDGYSGRDSQADEARPRRYDGPGARARLSCACQSASRRSRQRSSKRASPSRTRHPGHPTRSGAASPAPTSRRQSPKARTAKQPTMAGRGRLGCARPDRPAPHGVPRLLRDAGRAAHGEPGRHQEGLPQACAAAPSRRQQGRRKRGAALQGGQRGQRGPL